MKKCFVIGVFPPPYGGATIKCKLFSTLLEKGLYDVTNIDLLEMKRNRLRILKSMHNCISAFKFGGPIIYCLDTKRLKLILLLQSLFCKSFSNTTVLAIGGLFPELVLNDKSLKRRLMKVKGIWVETAGMQQKMESAGFTNTLVFPNPKSGKGSCPPVENSAGKLKLVFFSQISKEKGVLDIMKTVERLKCDHDIRFELDFYGHVVDAIKDEFEAFIEKNDNVRYCGVFDSVESNVYEKLNMYDIILFPSTWKAEGVPGILIEAKMAGLAIIASNHNYNAELVLERNKEGFLLKSEYSVEMENLIRKLYYDRTLLMTVKNASYDSRKRYSIDKYLNFIDKI